MPLGTIPGIVNGMPAKTVAIGRDDWRSSMVQFMDELIGDDDEEEAAPRRLN
jgi:hypothetical protein